MEKYGARFIWGKAATDVAILQYMGNDVMEADDICL
jgi:hypothetical protein